MPPDVANVPGGPPSGHFARQNAWWNKRNTGTEAAEKLCILFVINKVGLRERKLQKKTANYIHFDERKLLHAVAWCKGLKEQEEAGNVRSPADINFVFIVQPTGLPLCLPRVCVRCISVSLSNEDILFTVFCSSIYLFSLHFFLSILLFLPSVGLIDMPSVFCGSLVVVVVGVVLYFLAADRDTKTKDNKNYSSNKNKCRNKLAQFPSGFVPAPDSFAADAFLTMNISCQLSVFSLVMSLSFTHLKYK